MKNVADILKSKGSEIWSISPEASVYMALELMAEKDVGALIVLDGESIVGILSERDYARKDILHGESSKKLQVGRIMSKKVMFLSPERTVEETMALMTEKRIRHMPVVENDRLAGVISIGDVVKAMIDEKEFMIEQLERFIRSAY